MLNRTLIAAIVFGLAIASGSSGYSIVKPMAGREPEIGVDSQAVQGEAIYAEYNSVAKLVARPETDIVTKKVVVPAGTPLHADGEKGFGSMTRPMTPAESEKDGNLKNIRFYYHAPGGGYFTDTRASGKFDQFKGRALERAVKYRRDWLPAPELASQVGDTFRREIVYQGAGGGVLRLLYREFINDMARPAFSQELTYDLNVDGPTTVAVKACRIKVFEAGNEGIKYEILHGLAAE